MGAEFDADTASALLAEIKKARTAIDQRDGQTARRLLQVEDSVNELFKRANRPGPESGYSGAVVDERKDANELCRDRKSWSQQKYEGRREAYAPSPMRSRKHSTARARVQDAAQKQR